MFFKRTTSDLQLQALRYHRGLPSRIRTYLTRARGLSEEVINHHLLGWNGNRITIPVKNRRGEITFFRLARDPEDSASPKMISTPGSHVALYGEDAFPSTPKRIVISEGEFDRLVLESRGFHAVTSTGGAATFPESWARSFSRIPEVFICYDRDLAGRKGAERVARLIRHACLVRLPPEVGEHGDVTDFFVRLGHTPADFEILLKMAEPLPTPRAGASLPQPRSFLSPLPHRLRRRVEGVKRRAPIASVVGDYIDLRPAGRVEVGLCPFHKEQVPSFVVYPATSSYYCFACGAHGDAISFLRAKERLSFVEALERLENWH